MSDPKDWSAHVDTVSASIGLPIAPEYRQGVIDNFARIAMVAGIVLAFPLDDEAEPAPRFEP
jgi:hypothetical protein